MEVLNAIVHARSTVFFFSLEKNIRSKKNHNLHWTKKNKIMLLFLILHLEKCIDSRDSVIWSAHRERERESEIWKRKEKDHVNGRSSSIPRSSPMRCLQLRFQHLQKKGTSLVFFTFLPNFDRNFRFLVLLCYAPSLHV